MRNLKRALSLALAFIMVMSLMIVGTSAKTFTDAEDITNVEAVTIVDGLSVMNGYPDGSFKPEGIVTRAEMAVVISKMLYGPNFNPANFVGAEAFTDTPAWAEGYINLCASLGIIAGRGNGIFDPDATVTTSEASAMFLRALGYLQTEAEFGSDWQLAVTSKATNLGLYGDLELTINAGLSRENVAVMAFETLFAQRVAYDDYRGLYVKANDRNVVVTNGTDDEMNTLAQNTFGLYIAEGIVVANGQTDKKLSASLKSDAQTTIRFTEPADLNKDGKDEYSEGDTYDFEVETGLDMIGHAASVYYKIVNKTPEVYTIVDEATLVDYITYNSNSTRLADAANDAGFKKNTILDVAEKDYILNYDFDTTVGDAKFNHDDLDTLIVISNSGNYNVDCVIALDQYLDKVDMIDDEDEDKIDYELATSVADEMYVALDKVAEGDYVIVTDIGNQGDVLAFQAANVFSAKITKLTGISDGFATVKAVIADGTTYTESPVYANNGADKLELVTAFADISKIGTATLIVDQFGNLIGLSGEEFTPDYAYISEFGVRHSTGSLNTDNVLTAKVYFADGTSGVYEVDSFSGVANFPYDPQDIKLNDNQIVKLKAAMNAQYGQDAKTGALGIWDVKVDDDDKTIDIRAAVTTEETMNGLAGAAADGVRLVKGHSTFVAADNTNVEGVNANGCAGEVLYQNNETVYFYVNDGEVTPFIGIKNAVSFTNDNNIQQVFATSKETRSTVGAVLVTGIELSTANIYYYNEGNYHIEQSEDGVILTYDLFTLDGEAASVSYDYSSATAAKEDAKNHPDGYYYAKDKDIVAVVATDGTVLASNQYVKGEKGSTTYVVNDEAEYDEYVDNLYTHHDVIGTIAENVKIVDACGSGIDTMNRLVKAIKEKGDGYLNIAFTYDDEDYLVDVIFVSDYDPKATEAPGGDVKADYNFGTTLNAIANADRAVEVSGDIFDGDVAQGNMNAADVKATYTVTLTTSAGVTKTYTYVGTGDIVNGTFTGTIPSLTVSANGSIIYDVDVLLSVKDNNTTYTVGGSCVIG